jgi:hypothetical protein
MGATTSLVGVAVCLFVLVPPVLAQECLQRIGTWPHGPAETVAASGDYAYFGNGASFVVADVSDSAAPLVRSSLALNDAVLGIAVEGGIAYALTSHEEGDGDDSSCSTTLHAIDVADPSSPVEIATYGDPGWGCTGADVAV